MVIAVPDSRHSRRTRLRTRVGPPVPEGLIKNRYIGRTFIQPDQALREHGVRLKFNPLHGRLEGKRVVVVDDSIVRGTTTRKIVQMLREAGAREVHLRVSAPPIISPCFYGIDMADARGADRRRAQPRGDPRAPRRRLDRVPLAGRPPARHPAPGRPLLPRLSDGLLSRSDTRGGRERQAALRTRARAGMSGPEPLSYAQAGVSLAAADAVVGRLQRAVASTRTPRVLGDLGGFAGLVSAGGYRDPVLVAGTDGVGTKLLLQRETGRLRDSGVDLVAMCVNNVLTSGAEVRTSSAHGNRHREIARVCAAGAASSTIRCRHEHGSRSSRRDETGKPRDTRVASSPRAPAAPGRGEPTRLGADDWGRLTVSKAQVPATSQKSERDRNHQTAREASAGRWIAELELQLRDTVLAGFSCESPRPTQRAAAPHIWAMSNTP